MMTSKSFRAVLPSLDDDELERLREWNAENCAASAVFREDDAVIWLASKERTRSRQAFLRSARSILRRSDNYIENTLIFITKTHITNFPRKWQIGNLQDPAKPQLFK